MPNTVDVSGVSPYDDERKCKRGVTFLESGDLSSSLNSFISQFHELFRPLLIHLTSNKQSILKVLFLAIAIIDSNIQPNWSNFLPFLSAFVCYSLHLEGNYKLIQM